ncbi:MAG: prepilin-type N-terminal cleavage/methylation domain-containing protein [Elusimicrobiaceae bacterium]|nr:prepilin-type N-terminal cleavage/methylation domain-containing protein [Elusimicrobiaceae bacterium]
MKRKQAFTLIELLVVVLIIGILAAIALPQYQVAVMKSRLATLMPLVRAVKDAQEVYYLANNKYATSFEELDLSIPGGQEQVDETDNFVYRDVTNNIRVRIETRKTEGILRSSSGEAILKYQIYYAHDAQYPNYQVCWGGKAFNGAIQACKSYGGSVRYDTDEYTSFNIN